ncbi:MAG: YhbY family RNA-binding protein [Ruminococcaceae bacterium]|nr:YhbY family RNA-binding protein [Oscillospiraceae bacterium]
MLTSKQRAELRAQANGLDTTLMVGKGGVTEQVVAEAETQLEARELVKGRVLESALMSAREVLDALCEATGGEGISTVGSKFVIYRESERLKLERRQVGRAKIAPISVAKSNPVRKGAQARRKAARAERERRNEFFRQSAIEKSIEREKEKAKRREER